MKSESRKLKYEPAYYTDREIQQSIAELKGDVRFQRFLAAVFNLREESLGRMYHDSVIGDERLSLAYQVESRVYADILNMVEDAKPIVVPMTETA